MALQPAISAMSAATIPRLALGMKFRFDKARDAWVILGPERMFVPDEMAVEVLKLVDGARSLNDIATELATRFNAPPDQVLTDITAMFDDLVTRGAVTL